MATYNLQIVPYESTFNATNNTSNVKVSIYLGGKTGTIHGGDVRYMLPGASTWTSAGTLNNKTVSTTALTEIHSFTITVPHDSDGGGTLIVNVSLFNVNSEAYQGATTSYIELQNLNSNVSTLHYQNINDGSSTRYISIGTPSLASFSKPISSARLVLKQTIGDEVTVLLDTSSSDTYTFSYDTSLCNPSLYGEDVARNTSIPVGLILETYDQGQFIGANYYTVNVAYPLEQPVLTNSTSGYDYVTEGIDSNFLAAERASGLFFNNGLTKFEFACTATPQNYAYIRSAEISYVKAPLVVVTKTVYEDIIGEHTGAIALSGSVDLDYVEGAPATAHCSVTITDSRGVKNYIFPSEDVNLAHINAPTIQNAAIQRGTYSGGTWTQNEDDGTAIRFTGTLTSQSGSAVIKFSKNGTAVSTSTYNAGAITYYFTNCPTSSSTELLVEVNNYLSQTSYQFVAAPTKPDINYNSDIHGVAFGKLATEANMVDSEWQIRTSDTMTAQAVDISNASATAPQLKYRFSDKSNNVAGNIYVAIADGKTRFSLREYSLDSGGNLLSNYENFVLPSSDQGRSDNASYNILTSKENAQLSQSYTSNSYVSSTSFGNASCYRRAGLYIIGGMVNLSTAMPTGTDWTAIGSFGSYSALYAAAVTLPSQNGSGTVALRVSTNGVMSITNTCGSSVSGILRFSIVVPVA